MLAEALEPDGGIEADLRVVGRLPWAAEVQHDPVRVGPQIELLRGELAPWSTWIVARMQWSSLP
jgi:hypothetical protein